METNNIPERYTDEDLQLRTNHPKAVQLAMKGYFVRISELGVLVCPMGHAMRKKSVKRNGFTRFCNKMACRHCTRKCCEQPYKEVDMSPRKNVLPTPEKRRELKAAGLMVPLYLP